MIPLRRLSANIAITGCVVVAVLGVLKALASLFGLL